MENYQSKFQNARTVILSPELMELFPFLIFCNDKLVQSIYFCNNKSRKENPQKPTQLSSRSHPRHLVGKKDSTKDTIIDITLPLKISNKFVWSISLNVFHAMYLVNLELDLK